MMNKESQAIPGQRAAATSIRREVSKKKPVKTFTKLPANYSELSGEERKKWLSEASQTIVERLRDHDSDAPLARDDENS